MNAVTTAIRTLLSAFVDIVGPDAGRQSRRRRWAAVEADGDFDIYRIDKGKAALVSKASAMEARQKRAISSGTDARLELRLAPESVILSRFNLPAESEKYLEQIVEHRLDGLTPWRPDKVLFGYAVESAQPGDGDIIVEFAATSRDIAAASIARLEASGLSASAIGSGSEPLDQPLRIDLFRGGNDRTCQARQRRIAVAATSVLAVTALSMLGSFWVSASATTRLAELDQAIASARQYLIAASGSAADRHSDLALIDAKTPDQAMFTLVDRLSAVIPDTTYLAELEIEPQSIRLAGSSQDAAALIGILEAEMRWTDAKFVAPVTRDADGRDRFNVIATRRATVAAP